MLKTLAREGREEEQRMGSERARKREGVAQPTAPERRRHGPLPA